MDKQEYAARVEWMKRYRKSKRKECALMLRLSEAKDCASNIHSTSSGVRCQTADGVSGIQRSVERIERAEGALLDQREVCNALYRETLRVILKVTDTKQRRVMRLRYLAGWTMSRIAADMGNRTTGRERKSTPVFFYGLPKTHGRRLRWP